MIAPEQRAQEWITHSPIDDFAFNSKYFLRHRSLAGTQLVPRTRWHRRARARACKALKGRRGNILTGTEPLGVTGGAEEVEEPVLRMARELITPCPGIKWPRCMRAAYRHRQIVAAAFGDLFWYLA